MTDYFLIHHVSPQQITYFTHANSSRTTSETIVITEEDTRGCDVNQTEKIRLNISVPAVPPTDFSTSNIVKVRYSIRVSDDSLCNHLKFLKLHSFKSKFTFINNR